MDSTVVLLVDFTNNTVRHTSVFLNGNIYI